MLELIDSFVELLNRHDYSYDYSDDSNVYRRGLTQKKAIEERIKAHPAALQPVYDAYNHYWWKHHDRTTLAADIAQHKATVLITA